MRFLTSILCLISAAAAVAQTPVSPQRESAGGGSISGLVRDSIAHAPLAGAMVQLVAPEGKPAFVRTAISDSLGRFALVDIPDGRFTLGFYHPMLDSLGVEPPLREVSVDGQKAVHVDLAIPSAARLRAAICGTRPVSDSSALLVGFVRDAGDREPASGVTVTGEWLELSFRKDGMMWRVPRLVATTGEKGWFAMCNVPRDGTMALMATRGADSTDLIEVKVPADGFLRRELYIGPASGVIATVVEVDTVQRKKAAAAPLARTVRTGNGTLSGTVVTAQGGKPLAGALVRLADGPQTRANAQGEWIITGAPVGTRMLDVRALGYFPDRRRVDVVKGADPVRVELSTLKTVLDTVRILASRRVYDRDTNGFQSRMRSGMGRYLTDVDVARRAPIRVSELFEVMGGVRLEYDGGGFERTILVRGATSEWCAPPIFLNGQRLGGITADDLDVWVRPNEVKGIEVYAGIGAPMEYQVGLSGCGSILIWTK